MPKSLMRPISLRIMIGHLPPEPHPLLQRPKRTHRRMKFKFESIEGN